MSLKPIKTPPPIVETAVKNIYKTENKIKINNLENKYFDLDTGAIQICLRVSFCLSSNKIIVLTIPNMNGKIIHSVYESAPHMEKPLKLRIGPPPK